MAPGGRRDDAWCMYGASYSEIQRNTAEFHTACHTALSRMPRQRRVAWMCPSRSTCCHGCWVSPNTLAVTPSSPTGTLSACVSVRHLVLYSRNTIQLTIQLYCSIHVSRIVTPSPRRHTAIQRHTALYEHTAIQHHTAYSPYNTPQAQCTHTVRLR